MRFGCRAILRQVIKLKKKKKKGNHCIHKTFLNEIGFSLKRKRNFLLSIRWLRYSSDKSIKTNVIKYLYC